MANVHEIRTGNLAEYMEQTRVVEPEWSEPQHFKLSESVDQTVVERMYEDGRIAKTEDRVNEIADDLFEYENPSLKDDDRARQEYKDEILGKGEAFGEWVYFPWSKSLVRYADRESHQALRTARNRSLITSEEQQKLLNGTAAVFGLSVGGSAVDMLSRSGIGGTIITADMDVISPSNTNRLNAGQSEIGQKKIDVFAKRVSELDPFVKQVLLRDGVGEHNLEDVIETYNPDLMVDAVDSLPIKALIREAAKRHQVPVMMATDVGDRSLLDVEMYGHDPEAKPFGGRVSDEDFQKLLSGEITPDDHMRLLFSIVDPSNASERMLASVFEMAEGKLAGLPQLGTTAALGGIAVARVAREIILGNNVKSGRAYIDMDNILDLE